MGLGQHNLMNRILNPLSTHGGLCNLQLVLKAFLWVTINLGDFSTCL